MSIGEAVPGSGVEVCGSCAQALPVPESEVSGQQLLALGGIVAGAPSSQRARAVQAHMVRQAREHAQLLRDLAAFHVDAQEGDPALVRREQAAADLACAAVLRCDVNRARVLIAHAATAIRHLPRALSRLEQAHLPAPWFDRILRSTAALDAEELARVDAELGEMPLERLSYAAFRRRLRLLVLRISEAARTLRPRRTGCVRFREPDLLEGTVTMEITGPIDRMTAFGARINAAARAVQDQQRHALTACTDPTVPGQAGIPFDVQGQVEATGMPLSLGQLRFEILTGSVLDTGTVPVPATQYRVNVTVPAATLMGVAEEPGLLGGDLPIPADMARDLAARASVWHRFLVDPGNGRFLPGAARRYRPSPEMIEAVQMSTPVCAAPGCTRPAIGRCETDHIEEFDHASPADGGPTDPANLHILCRAHHQVKTDRLIDPERTTGHTTRWNLGNDLRIDIEDNQDLSIPTLPPEYQEILARIREQHPTDETGPPPY